MEKMKEFAKRKTEHDVSAYQTYIRDLYSVINEDRDFADLYGYLHRNIGILGKSIPLDLEPKIALSKFVLPISWLFSIANNLGINVLEALIRKYPGICPYCLESKCVCYKTSKKPLRPMPAHEIKERMYYKWEEIKNSKVKFNLDKAVNFITEIFPINEIIWKTSGPRDHILKIHEELTEIHEAYGSFKKGVLTIDAIEDEIADVFAWILGAWGIKHPPSESLDNAFIDYYLEDCPECKSVPCHCGLYNSPVRSLLDFNKIFSIKEKLIQLSKILPGYEKEFTDLIKSYDDINETHNVPIAKATLSQTKEKLEDLLRTISTIDMEGKSSSTIYSILEIINLTMKYEGREEIRMKQYDVFLSYATINKTEASKIYEYLDSKGTVVFMSEKTIQPSSKWEDIIKDAMKNSRLLCTLATPDSLKSDWVRTEWDWAIILDKPIVPVLFRCAVKDLPKQLQDYHAIDFHDYEKIWDVLKNLP